VRGGTTLQPVPLEIGVGTRTEKIEMMQNTWMLMEGKFGKN